MGWWAGGSRWDEDMCFSKLFNWDWDWDGSILAVVAFMFFACHGGF